MRARMYLVAAAIPALLATPALAGGPVSPLLFGLIGACSGDATVTQCAYQGVKGNHNIAITEQSTVHFGRRHSTQFAVTLQHGNGNVAYTGQVGKDQLSVSSQDGNNNGAFTYQEGKNQLAITVEDGNGQWAATSSIGNNTSTFVALSNY